MTARRRVRVLLNPGSGSAEQAGALHEKLEREGIALEPTEGAALEERARQLALEGIDVVVAAGGDGTVAAVARGLAAAGQGCLGLLPLGTGNDFSRTIAVPDDLDDALEVILRTGRSRPLDLIAVRTPEQDVRRALNVLTGGNAGRVSNTIDSGAKKRWGALSYLAKAFEVVSDLEVFDVHLRADGGQLELFQLNSFIIGNGQFTGGGMHVAPYANPGDGFLDASLILDAPPLEDVELAANFLFGDYIEHPDVVYRRARQLDIESDPPLPYSIDGEGASSTARLSLTVEPAALKVLTGPEYQAVRIHED